MDALFGRTQTADQTPFEAEPLRPNGFTVITVQEAIEQGLNRALSNDKYPVFASYNGNANNRSLEMWPGINMAIGPFRVFKETYLLSIVIAASANSNGAVALYDRNVSTTVPVYTIPYGGASQNQAEGTFNAPLATFLPLAQIEARVINASAKRPHIFFFLTTAEG